MVVTESEMISKGEVESTLQSDQRPKNYQFTSLGRQSSIYSLTLDEFQHTLCESGKNFGSMNMDEFLTSIWNAEENQSVTANNTANQISNNNNYGNQALNDDYGDDTTGDRGIAKQLSLSRQGSLTLPAPLCGKTVDEVWSEIHNKGQQGQVIQSTNCGNNGVTVQNPESAPRQPTFGEMTLEDFLIKAGVVREQCNVPTMTPQQQQYGVYQSNNGTPFVGTGFVSRSMLGVPASGVGNATASYQTVSQGAGSIGESSGRNGGYPPPTAAAVAAAQPAAVYGGRVGNGSGYGPGQAVGVVGSVSPVSSEGLVTTVDNATNQYGMEMEGSRGRKRIIDGPVEKVVERRQRRMIKNRESAARSRARKQAYTVELEAELNQLKEENRQLKQALVELERKRKQEQFEVARMKAQTKAHKGNKKLMLMRRNLSCPL